MTSARREPGESDSTTLRRLQRDPQDESAWRQFIAKASPRLLHFLFRLTRNVEVARDILQDVLLRFVAQKSIRKVKDMDSALALLHVMARHRFIDWLRSARTYREASSEESAVAIGATEAPNSGETAAILESELERLEALLNEPEQQLLALMLKGHEVQAVADALHVSYSTAAVRIFRLREKLRHLSDTRLYG